MTVLFGILGIVLGVSCGLFIVVYLLKKSNDFGDSYGNTKDYEGEFILIDREDHVSRSGFERGGSRGKMDSYIDKLNDFFSKDLFD